MSPAFTFWPAVDRPAEARAVAMPWSTFARRVERARPAASKDTLPRLACVEFRDGYRSLANVLRVHAVVLDADDGTDLGTIVGSLVGTFTILHSTFSATEMEPRWRIFVPLDRPVSADEYPRAYRFVAEPLERAGARLDHRGPAQAWAVPARPPSGFYVSHVTPGAFVDVAAGLDRFPPPAPLPAPAARPERDDLARRLERASRYLATMPPSIAGSGGHLALWRAALALVLGFNLSADDALRLLVEEFSPRCSPIWSVRELCHKVRSALQRGRLAPGWLADRPLSRGA